MIVGIGFGAYLLWQKMERDRLAAMAVTTPEVVAVNPDIPEPEAYRPPAPVVDPDAGKPAAPPPPPPPPPVRFDDPSEQVEITVTPRRNADATDLDKRVWGFVSPSKNGTSLQKNPYAISMAALTRRRQLGELLAEYEKVPAEQVVAHPLAADFPGAVSERAPRVRVYREYAEPQASGWISTGLYAAPGELINVELSEADAKRGLAIRIGAHTDDILETVREEWHRFPRISRQFPLNRKDVVIANPFGGPIYITGKVGSLSEERPLRMRFTGVVKSPTFILGKTTPAEWLAMKSSTAGVPWGELVGKNMVATLPGNQLRNIPKPEVFAEFWDGVVARQDEFVGLKRGFPERVVYDAEITHGYGHSGYPICILLDKAPDHTANTTLKSDNWAVQHELGHNHLNPGWTFKGWAEAMSNLVAMYSITSPGVVKLDDVHGGTKWDEIVLRGIAFKDKKDTFGHLAMFVPIVRKFGWEPVKKAASSYATDPVKDGDDDDKRAEFLYRLSVACNADLSGYAELFGQPTRTLLAYKLGKLEPKLKPWMPTGFPPNSSKLKRAKKRNSAEVLNEDLHLAAEPPSD